MNTLMANVDCVYKITKEFSSQPDIKKNGKPRKRYYADFTGRKFGYLEVIKRSGSKGTNALWECYCHACGKTKYTITNQLRKYTKSCGCQRTKREWTSPYWKGVGEISRMIITGYKNNAKRRKIYYDIPDEYLWDIFIKQERKCALSGLDLNFGRSSRVNITASLDRIDSSLPYIVGNVQWVHKHINAMKLNHKEEYFILLCKTVVDYNLK